MTGHRAVAVVAPTRPSPVPARPGRGHLLVSALPAALLLVVGGVQVALNPALWYDEAYTRLAADVPVSTLLSGIWDRTGVIAYLTDVPPSFNGPYYLLMHYWVAVFGDSQVSLRLPSLLCSAAAVAVLTRLAARVAGPDRGTGAGLVCGLMCATSALLVDEAAQARSYGAAMLALALCALWLQRWQETGRGAVRTAAVGAVAALLHWFCLPVLVGFAVTAALTRLPAGMRTGRVRAVMAGGLVAAMLPAGALVAWSLLGGAAGAPTPLAAGWLLPVRAVVDWSGDLNALAAALTVAAVVGATVGVARLPGDRRRNTRLLLLGWVVVPLGVITAVDLVHPIYYPRYLLFPMLGFAPAAALGVVALRARWARLTAAAVLVAVSLGLTVPRISAEDREPSPAAVALLAGQQTAGQPIVAADGRTALDLMTYLSAQPRLASDLVLPPTTFTDQTSSHVVWLVRVVLKVNSLPVVPAEQRLTDAGWTMQSSTLLVGTNTDLRVEQWTR